MKKLTISILSVAAISLLASCNTSDPKHISVCASDKPHAIILEQYVAPELAKLGYSMSVTVLNWQFQNDAVYNGDYDANYFQHMPYLNKYTHSDELFMTAKVHYEPLGLYEVSSSKNTACICSDTSNAIRALDLLLAEGKLTTDGYKNGDELSFSGSTYTENGFTVTLIEEETLVASMADYGYACLPYNTALTGSVTTSPIALESNADAITTNSNGFVCRKGDYENNADYKAKVDAVIDILLSSELSTWATTYFGGKLLLNNLSQIDLRTK